MADKLTDAEIAEELKRHGETVKFPFDRKRRSILIKKLNHIRARQKPSPSKKSSRNKNTAEFSSESEDEETRAAPSSAVGRIFSRQNRKDSHSHSYSNTDTIEISPPRRSNRNRDDASSTKKPGNSFKSLYPDLSALTQAHTSKSYNDRNDMNNFQDEFTDSDPDESVYEVENRSMNTTFPLLDTNVDRYDGNDTVSHRTGNARRRTLQNETLRSKLDNSILNHTPDFPNDGSKIDKKEWCKNEPSKHAWASFISTAILIIVVIFFLLLAATYVYIRKDILLNGSSMDNLFQKDNFSCSKHSSSECAKIKQDALNVVHEYERLLKAKSGKEEIDKLKKVAAKKSSELPEDVYNLALEFICQNKHWNIRAYDKDKVLLEEACTVAVYLETDPDLDLITRLGRSIWKIVFGLMLLLSCVLAMVLGIVVLRYHNKSKEEEQQRVFQLVDKIIDVIEKNYDLHQEDPRTPPYMAVSHVRDQLLPPKQRQKMRPLWEKAVKFVEANESRIRIETQTMQGEDFEVWRWLPSTTNGGKVWQGQAFGENNSSNSALHYSPTPCLKIRNMFDADYETEHGWDVNIKDALLEKCEALDGILHIYVDSSSKEGCVYLKCDSCETAYKVYKSLHGWWFDGRLVTVKYLRLELYEKKYPESRSTTKSLKPSNSKMSSLSQPYHRSSLEMT